MNEREDRDNQEAEQPEDRNLDDVEVALARQLALVVQALVRVEVIGISHGIILMFHADAGKGKENKGNAEADRVGAVAGDRCVRAGPAIQTG